MKLTYDEKANVAYIAIRERRGAVDTLEITADFLVDIDETGAVCGIELLNANEQLGSGGAGKIVLENPASGERAELKVA